MPVESECSKERRMIRAAQQIWYDSLLKKTRQPRWKEEDVEECQLTPLPTQRSQDKTDYPNARKTLPEISRNTGRDIGGEDPPRVVGCSPSPVHAKQKLTASTP